MENLKLPAVTICPRFSTQEFLTQYTSRYHETICQMLEPGAETLPGGEKATQAQSFGTLCSISAGGSYQITGSYQYQHQCSWISIKHLINNKINNIISRASVKVLRIWIVRACQYWFNSHMAKSWILIHCNFVRKQCILTREMYQDRKRRIQYSLYINIFFIKNSFTILSSPSTNTQLTWKSNRKWKREETAECIEASTQYWFSFVRLI